jgi:hypothetical protein
VPTMRLPAAQANDIEVICSFGPDFLEQAAAAIEAIPLTIERNKIQSVLTKFGSEKAEPLDRVLFGLAVASRRRFDKVSTLLDSISPPVAWDGERRRKWNESLKNCRRPLERLLSAESIVLATKALDLSFDVERFCVAARIITDIRPVFDTARSQIVGSTIRHTFRLEYAGIDGTTSSMSVGLDANDIAKIKEACEEAGNKVAAVQKLLKKGGISEIIIPGEET